MYVRWKQKRLTKNYGRGKAGGIRWRAELVECVRVDGKPRQKHIASIVSFTDYQLTMPTNICFEWQNVYYVLDSLDISKADKARAIRTVATKLPYRTRKQCEINERECIKSRKMFGG